MQKQYISLDKKSRKMKFYIKNLSRKKSRGHVDDALPLPSYYKYIALFVVLLMHKIFIMKKIIWFMNLFWIRYKLT